MRGQVAKWSITNSTDDFQNQARTANRRTCSGPSVTAEMEREYAEIADRLKQENPRGGGGQIGFRSNGGD
jgi:hypothetical protein